MSSSVRTNRSRNSSGRNSTSTTNTSSTRRERTSKRRSSERDSTTRRERSALTSSSRPDSPRGVPQPQPQQVILMTAPNTSTPTTTTTPSSWRQQLRPMFVLGAYAALATVLWVFFLSRALGVYGLKRQIARLEEEVTILDAHIEDLQIEVNRLEDVTEDLSILNTNLENSVVDLGNTVADYADLHDDFDINLVEQNELNLALNESLEIAKELNAALDKSTKDLNNSYNTISDINNELSETIENTKELNDQLKVTTDQISKTDGTLSNRVDELRVENSELEDSNLNLQETNDNLLAVLSYIEEAGNDFDDSFKSMMNVLGSSINKNREYVLKDLEISYEMKYENWLCDGVFENRFRDREWINDRALSIGTSDYSSVLAYLDANLFGELCIVSENFNFFVSNDSFINTNQPSSISFSELISAIERYSTELMNYYFQVLSDEVWVEAEYECEKLPNELLFEYNF